MPCSKYPIISHLAVTRISSSGLGGRHQENSKPIVLDNHHLKDYTPRQDLVARQVTDPGPGGEPTTITLLNLYSIQLPSKHLYHTSSPPGSGHISERRAVGPESQRMGRTL